MVLYCDTNSVQEKGQLSMERSGGPSPGGLGPSLGGLGRYGTYTLD